MNRGLPERRITGSKPAALIRPGRSGRRALLRGGYRERVTAHENARPVERALCNQLLVALQSTAPAVRRKNTGQWCTLDPGRQPQFAYVKHTRTGSHLTVYFGGDAGHGHVHPPPGVQVRQRGTSEVGWSKRFPFSFSVDESSDVATIARFLHEAREDLEARRGTIRARKSRVQTNRLPEEIDAGEAAWEGAIARITVNKYERDRKARSRCLAHHGSICCVCGFDFGVYGGEFAGIIHVHHLVPISTIKSRYKLDPIRDLRPVCPNCHAALHRQDPPLGIEDLRMLRQRRGIADTPPR